MSFRPFDQPDLLGRLCPYLAGSSRSASSSETAVANHGLSRVPAPKQDWTASNTHIWLQFGPICCPMNALILRAINNGRGHSGISPNAVPELPFFPGAASSVAG